MKNLSCIILAGGESRRMGEDKGLKIFRNQALISYSIQLATKLCDNILISTNNPDYIKFDYPLIYDIIPNKGPMGGIYSGLSVSKTDWNLFLPCDTPFLQLDILLKMQKHLSSNKIVVPKLESDQIQPLIGFYHKDLLPLIKNHLENDRLKIMGLLNKTKTYYQIIRQENASRFLNINTIKELKINE